LTAKANSKPLRSIWKPSKNGDEPYFERLIMFISLVGMSGSGKSYWSKRLSESGFRHFCCDDAIAAKLSSGLSEKNDSIEALGCWMGFPFEPHYKEREARYLACEVEVMIQILDELAEAQDHPEMNVVVDTTGSVIYTGEEILRGLRDFTTVVHLSTPQEIQKLMLENYISARRPILWRKLFIKKSAETNDQALARCYPQLLASREAEYENLAHVTIDYYRHRSGEFRIEDFLHDAAIERV
jgi:shikimate kinase